MRSESVLASKDSGSSSGAPVSERAPPSSRPPSWASALTSVGVTGTNGKTTTTTMIAAALGSATEPVACVTTLGASIGQTALDVRPDYEGFIESMRAALDMGARRAAVECTSEALARGFARAWPCRVGVFTNCTRDHLDAHGSAEHYLASKAQLLMHVPAGGSVVLNAADPASALLAEVVPEGVRILRYVGVQADSVHGRVDLRATAMDVSWAGTRITYQADEAVGREAGTLHVRAIGTHFGENALAAVLAARAVGVPMEHVVSRIAQLPVVRGRFEVFGTGPRVVIDYAHTPDALRRTVATADRLCPGRVRLVFGAGGDRDRAKRPSMGEAATAAATIVLTSDNPRSEDARVIAREIRSGLGSHPDVTVELDRAVAIERAIAQAAANDVVLIAGKGHETAQSTASGTRRFSDHEVVEAALQRR